MNRFQDIRFRSNQTTFLPQTVARRIVSQHDSAQRSFRIRNGVIEADTSTKGGPTLF